jgi:hypothetical protein
VVAGIPIQIDVLEQKGSKGWSARIGCHSDDLGVSLTILLFLSVSFKIEL